MGGVRGSILSMLHVRLLGLVGLAFCAGCARRPAPAPSRGEASGPTARAPQAPRCFDVTARDDSPSTREVFRAKRCQGGGVTWAAILEVLVHRRGASTAVEGETPGWTGDVRALSWKGGTKVRVAIDDEADAARFCAGSDEVLAAVRGDVARVNASAAELERAMREADPLALECAVAGLSGSTWSSAIAPPPRP
jgi:hypothetical protein